jgi:hypothetical protein
VNGIDGESGDVHLLDGQVLHGGLLDCRVLAQRVSEGLIVALHVLDGDVLEREAL